jgi:hypothetical protein
MHAPARQPACLKQCCHANDRLTPDAAAQDGAYLTQLMSFLAQMQMQALYGPAYGAPQVLPPLQHSLAYQKGGFLQAQHAQQQAAAQQAQQQAQQQPQQRMEVTVPVPESRVHHFPPPLRHLSYFLFCAGACPGQGERSG